MIGLVIAAACAGGAALIAIVRVVGGRSERKSVEGYVRVLDTLGDVTRRGDARAPVRLPEPSSYAPLHVRPQSESAPTLPWEPTTRIVLPAPVPPVPVGRAAEGPGQLELFDAPAPADPAVVEAQLQASRRSLVSRLRREAPPAVKAPPIEHALPVLQFDDAALEEPLGEPDVRLPRRIARSRADRSHGALRVAAAFVLLGAIGFGAWRLVDTHHPGGARAAASSSQKSAPTPTPTTLPTVLQPSSSTTSLVAFTVPAGAIHLSFGSTALAWLGVFAGSPSSPSYRWMDTLQPNQSATFDAAGPVYVRLGNPPRTNVTVDSIPLALPSSNVAPYDIELIPS